ncbi:hypothetical protein BDV93DRAFT_501066 [Ceratobasidium sp. AG-I]|nr:hypothetical protein BDV93DRAFT_501066 [Ceratobasidium sp. AG-I]
MNLCPNDGTIGPRADCRNVDFTIKFEHAVMSITPDCVFIALAFARILYLSRQGSKLRRPGYLHCAAKAFSALALIGTTLATYLLLYNDIHTLGLPKITLISSSLSLGASVVLAVLFGLEHFRSLTPSSVILSFSLLKGLCNGVVVRTYVLLRALNSTGGRHLLIASTLGITSYFLILIVESIQKRCLFNIDYQDYPEECATSIFSRLTFYWLLPLLRRGRKTKLELEDLANIPPQFKAMESRASFELGLSRSSSLGRSLLRASLLSFGYSFVSPMVACLALVFATFAQPLLVNALLRYIQSGSQDSGEGWIIVADFVGVYGVLTLATAVYWEKVFNAAVQYRGALVGAILQKSLRIASYESRSIGPAKAATYMSVDVGQISEGIERFYDVFSAAVSIVLGIIILYSKAQWAAFMPILIIIITMSLTSYCGKIIGGRYGAWMAATDKRIKLTASVISNLVPIKMSAYEAPLASKLGVLRDAEMARASKFFSMLVINITLSNASSVFCAVAVLGTYAWMVQRDPTKGTFDAASVFTILTTVQLLSFPLATIGQVLPSLFSSYTSLKRVEAFLNLEDKPTTGSNKTSILEDLSQFTADFQAIRIFGVDAAWDKKSKPVLSEIDLTLQSGKLYMCIGPVASGKTSLVNAMLGEMVITKGELVAPRSSIAYVAQDAFIFPATLRENILFGASFDSVRYEAVIAGCALGPDLARLDDGDETILGDKGTTLSGGQKQRVALARAVYSDAPVVLLDDPLSALDAETEKHVSKALFGSSGLLKGRTVFMITHSLRHLPAADGIVVMNQGVITFQGSLDELQASGYNLSHLVQATEPPRNNQSAEKNDQAPARKEQKDGKKANGSNHSNELKRSYTPQGLRPYRFWAHMAGGYRVAISLSVIALSATLSMGMNVYAKFWSDSDENMRQWILGYFGLSIAYFTLSVLAFSYWYKHTNIVASKAIHEKGLLALMAAPASYIQNTPAGLLINRFSQSLFLSVLSRISGMAFYFHLSYWLSHFFLQVLIAIATPWLAISYPFLGLTYWFLIKFYLATSTQLQQLESASKSPLFSAFGTVITGLETIR